MRFPETTSIAGNVIFFSSIYVTGPGIYGSKPTEDKVCLRCHKSLATRATTPPEVVEADRDSAAGPAQAVLLVRLWPDQYLCEKGGVTSCVL